ncbi:MAG: hypothetical protein ABI644_12075 [Arenimonas sp.]
MKIMIMMQTAVVLFALAALGGILMAGIRFSGRPRPPSWLAMGHGFMAAAGLTLLIYAELTVGIPALAELALGLFIVAAMGGAMMNLLFHSKQLPLPIPLMLLHATLAVSAFVVLLCSVF